MDMDTGNTRYLVGRSPPQMAQAERGTVAELGQGKQTAVERWVSVVIPLADGCPLANLNSVQGSFDLK